jgi:YVTN family beta-propeller protein
MLSRTRWSAVILIGMLALAACGASSTQGSKPRSPSIGKLAATITLKETAQQTAANTQGIWFLNALDDLAVEVDPITNHVVASLKLGILANNLLVTPEVNALWVTRDDGTVTRTDLGTGKIVATIPISTAGVYALTATSNPPTLWVTAVHDDKVVRIDMRTNMVVATIDVGTHPEDVEAAKGSVWVCNLRDNNSVQEIDPQTNQVTTRITQNYSPGGVGCGSIRFTENALWVMTHAGANGVVLLRLDPTTYATVASIHFGQDYNTYPSFDIGADASGVWVVDRATWKLMRVDAKTNRIRGTLAMSQRPNQAIVASGAVWVTNQYNNPDSKGQNAERTGDTLWRITPAP